MKTYGETVYGTRAGEIAPGAWGVSTRKGDRLFVHVLRRDGDTLLLVFDQRLNAESAMLM